MTEKPILFNAEMVRAVLDGRKTMTRRVIKFKDKINPGIISPIDNVPLWCDDYGDWQEQVCPYGKPGDELWVRETFGVIPWSLHAGEEHCELFYNADSFTSFGHDKNIFKQYPNKAARHSRKLRPSIHMPRWASRIQLRITNIRVERVQDITPLDIESEGVEFERLFPKNDYGFVTCDAKSAFQAWEALWNSINEKRGYGLDKNPHVWVVEFERIRP